MNKLTSKDGTQIAYDVKGSGPAVILVDPAICFRSFGPMQHLSEILSPHFTVYTYDRRGRGESSNSKPFAVDREIEDIDTVIQTAGGSAFVYGISSGACLALEAAIKLGSKIKKLALYEPPYNAEKTALPEWEQYREQLRDLLAENRRGDAVVLFMRFVGTPADQITGMRQSPAWQIFESVAPTLAYDAAAMGEDRKVPVERVSNLHVPTLVMDGSANFTILPWMHATVTTLAKALPYGQLRTLEGQTHDVNLEILAPVLEEFFRG